MSGQSSPAQAAERRDEREREKSGRGRLCWAASARHRLIRGPAKAADALLAACLLCLYRLVLFYIAMCVWKRGAAQDAESLEQFARLYTIIYTRAQQQQQGKGRSVIIYDASVAGWAVSTILSTDENIQSNMIYYI